MIYLDIHDISIHLLLSQITEVSTMDLNGAGLPDVYWVGLDGVSYGLSRKQPGEIFAGIDQVEEQLSRDYQAVDRLALIIEGPIIPVSEKEATTLRWSGDGKLAFKATRKTETIRRATPSEMIRNTPKPAAAYYQFNYFGWRKWLASVKDWGIDVWECPDRNALVTTIKALYEHSLIPSEEHQTFKRVIRTKQQMSSNNANPYVRTMMGLVDAETGRTFCGEQIALALEARFGNPMATYLADEKDIADTLLASGRRVGDAFAKKMKKAVGL